MTTGLVIWKVSDYGELFGKCVGYICTYAYLNFMKPFYRHINERKSITLRIVSVGELGNLI